MGPGEDSLRERLLAQQEPAPEQLARYRREVGELLEGLRRRKWWADLVRAVLTTLGAVVLLPLAGLFGLIALYLLAGGRAAAAWLPAAAGGACLAGAALLLRWYFRHRADELLLEVKRLHAQGLELEERLRRPADGR